jgi:predicted XRE-type DNA-binding protein
MPWEKVDIDQWAEELGVNINELRQKEQLIVKIVKSRKRFGLTQGQLAELIGVSQPRIAQIENRVKIGKTSFDILFNILNVLGHDFKITTRKVRELDLQTVS